MDYFAGDCYFQPQSVLIHKFCNGYSGESHTAARAVLFDFLDQESKYREIDRSILLRHLYRNSLEIIDRQSKNGKVNDMTFPDFIEELVYSVQDYLRENGLKIEVVSNSIESLDPRFVAERVDALDPSGMLRLTYKIKKSQFDREELSSFITPVPRIIISKL